ncbi:DUF4062 domain-containing protein [Bradyrhizobium tropiciagri]|uniref:DUF4062 domain-containing protein n=1 Tax=Bradyrhizobium tropiciagri TaxID=312253 RepID=UPI001BAC3273|nr:DUF4062 domain-containing protein [Bradyrhizobium tropiciagri]MBR0900269.1 DUF4062 domain-containing protein [Bradyrhizobium tropiciagri]
MDRPTIFISSTIYDFRDMRSAIKDHLEENGCRVLASEFNDFTKPLDKHSYQACLDTIQQADFFLLLIGTRVGGWYDAPNRVSITQQEYRTAYELAQEGKIKLLSFVREEVWLHRESTKELSKYLESVADLDDEIRRNIESRPTKFASDNDFIVSFIDEISRNKETAEAVKGCGPMPIGNWVHPFTRFSDIRDVIDPLILNGLSVRHAAGRKALQNQLLTLLRDLVPIIKDKPLLPANMILNVATEIDLKVDDLTRSIRLSDRTYGRLASLALYAPNAALNEAGLDAALGSDLLLKYEPADGNFRQTPAYDLLTELLDQIRKFEKARSGFAVNDLLVRGLPSNRGADRSVTVLGHIVAGQLQILFRWADIVAIARALALFLDGQPSVAPQRMPLSALREQEDELKREKVSLQQVREFAGLETAGTTPKAQQAE